MRNINAIVEGCSALVHGAWEDRVCCGQWERWEPPVWCPLAPEQSRECCQPFPAAEAAGSWVSEEDSFCWLQGRVPFTFLSTSSKDPSPACSLHYHASGKNEHLSRLQAKAPPLP